MTRRIRPNCFWLTLVWLIVAVKFLTLFPQICHALCATVKIEIRQELTLERQAFDAHMRINNGLSHAPIENVAVTVNFADEKGNPVSASSDPNNTAALFFIRVDRMANITNVTGSGSVAPESSADIHWLIIPAPGASNGLESGTMYFVGAALTYSVGGQSETIQVTPDHIFVKPMPQLVLDYFLPTDIYGDDAWTSTVEAPVPFYLGLRIANKGYGYARSLKVESAQPKIVSNDLDLLIGFQIDGSTVNGRPATNSLIVDFGDIAPNKAGTARWILSCTLSGRFVDFDAEFSHADELGGKMTSLIAEDDVRTHFLVRSVLVDAPGRDAVEDFLAIDNDVYRVYESDNIDTPVTNQSSDATLTSAAGGYRFSTPPTAGFMYARVPDPTHGSMLIKEAMRSDGKSIKPANVWFSKTRAGSGPWRYFLNIFDHNTPGTYAITFQSPADVPQPPVIMFIPERTRVEGQQLSFIVEASDPNGTIPALSVDRLPVGASFVDQGNGSGIFDWTPGVGQAGRYSIRFIATDGTLESSRQAVIRIFSQHDTDGDGMLDSWELEHFGTLERDGTGDFDGDGISDLDEFLNGLDPTESQSVPSVPEIIHPQSGVHIEVLTPDLEIINSIDPENDPFTYTFEVYADKEFKVPVAIQIGVVPQSGTTAWRVPVALTDNQFYYWRVRATDAAGSSNWAYGHFFTDLENDPPSPPGISFPADGTSVNTQTPVLEISNSRDPDDDFIAYDFEVYTDSAMTEQAAFARGVPAGVDHHTAWTVEAPLENGFIYYWRAIAHDGRGGQTAGPLVSFQADTAHATLAAPAMASPLDGDEIHFGIAELAVNAQAGDHLAYHFEIDTLPTFDGSEKTISEPIAPLDRTATWTVHGLQDNTRYYWRVKCSDGAAESRWSRATFFVNSSNDPPPDPELGNPGVGAWVNTLTPVLSAHPVTDIDEDELRYRFEIYTDPDLMQPVGYVELNDPVWMGISALSPGKWYYWRVQAVDEHGIPGQWSETGSFFVKQSTFDQPPHLVFLAPTEPVHTNAQGILIRWSDADPDSSARIALYYDTDGSGTDAVLIVEGIEEDPDGIADYYTWDISGLEGFFHLFAVIADDTSSITVYCPATVSIDRTPPVVTASPPGGAFSEPVQVSLTAGEAATMYYTLDGSEPDIGSQTYSTPLVLHQNTTVRFMAVDTAGNQSAAVTETYTLQGNHITVTVADDQGRPIPGSRVYAFNATGTYTGHYLTTDGIGQVHFEPSLFAVGNYKFRVNYLGAQFWSDTVALPDTRSIPVIIAQEAVMVNVVTAAGPAVGTRVYLFNATGTSLGQYLTTNELGQVIFYLPVDMTFQFRADLYSNQYWSDTVTVAGGSAHTVPVNAGGGLLQVALEKGEGLPLGGIRVYLFNTAGRSLGVYRLTDGDGRAGFDVPEGVYRLRADYMGYQFWSSDTQVVTDTLAPISIAHQQTQVRVEGVFQGTADPIVNINVYLFSAAGTYMGITLRTDDQGRATFDLPDKAYKIRANHMGRQFWSEHFTWQDPVVSVSMADALVTVTGAGNLLPFVRVYPYTESGIYLGFYTATDFDGRCRFRLPEGTYRFRADYQGGQFWSDVQQLTADQINDVGVSTGGGAFLFTLLKAQDLPLPGAVCRVFTEAGRNLQLYAHSNAAGQSSFDLSNGAYQFRIDYLGYQFWSEVVQVPELFSAAMTIAHTPVEVVVTTAAGPVPSARVYLFKEDGTSQGLYFETDDQGRARFDLPAGGGYMFRATVLGNLYWSDPITVPETAGAPVIVDAGGGRLQLTVQEAPDDPLPGLRVALFSENQRSLGVSQATDDAGRAFFDLPRGIYILRIDYLGYSYWTDPIEVTGHRQVDFFIDHQDVNITVQGHYGGVDTPIPSVRVNLFTPTGSYLRWNLNSDEEGRATFSLPLQAYMVRVDFMGAQFWSNAFEREDQTVTIPMADVQVAVTGAGLPKEGIRVYLFSDAGVYLNRQVNTDASGQATFHVPAGTYLFRADYLGTQYWSTPQGAVADQVNPVVISVGGGTFALALRRDPGTPMAGVRCYVFTGSGRSTGYFGATDEQGVVTFELPDATFRFRSDYLGYSYWSQNVTIPDTLSTHIDIAHQERTVTVTGKFLNDVEPLSGIRVYLFTPADRSMGLYRTTDEEGRVVFSLPEQAYKIRADYLGGRFWSQPFSSGALELQIMQGAVNVFVTRNMNDVSGARVYLFTPEGRYLSRYHFTDSSGWTSFVLPEGAYRFRVDLEGVQYWSTDIEIVADQTEVLEIVLP